jgi:hypothetical protein
MAALPLIVFDVNATLLDFEMMEPSFERIFGEKSTMRLGSPTSSCIPRPWLWPAATFRLPISVRL